uniref:UbiA prenyltransferase n=1 Tax=Moniliophthora roreri TaxID=221103 RepID=A0A0W0FSS7_MONRR
MFSRPGKDQVDAWMPFTDDTRKPSTSFVQQYMKHGIRLFWTSHAFCTSDYKTIIIPVTCYGLLASSRIPRLETMIHLLTWIWLFLLQFCAANQMYSIEEDSINKPYRPIPSGLISTESAYTLRWALVPMCLYLSWNYGVLYAGISLTLATTFYNEFGLDSYWYSKSLLNAIGIVSWNVGAAYIASEGHQDLLVRYHVAPFISVALIWSTIHVQVSVTLPFIIRAMLDFGPLL